MPLLLKSPYFLCLSIMLLTWPAFISQATEVKSIEDETLTNRSLKEIELEKTDQLENITQDAHESIKKQIILQRLKERPASFVSSHQADKKRMIQELWQDFLKNCHEAWKNLMRRIGHV